MSPHNWKNLERTAAARLQGQRLSRGADFSQSIPDIRLPYAKKVVVDCKYSINVFNHHKKFLKALEADNKSANKKPRYRIDEFTYMLPSEKKSQIRSLIGEAESKYGKPTVIITRNKGQNLILASIREDFYQELLMGSKIDDGVFIVVMTIDQLMLLFEKRYGPIETVVEPKEEVSWEEWE